VTTHHHEAAPPGHVEAAPRPSEAGGVVLDIGPGAGVAIVRTGPAMCGLEMEIRRVGEDWKGQHVYVRRRDGAGTPQFAAVFGSLALGTVLVLYRPLLLASVSPDLASARRLPVRLIGALYLLAMALAVALSAITIGAILSTALLVGPAATALQLTRRPGHAMLVAALVGIGAMWLGILLAYDSYYWSSDHHAWPVSFFVVALVLLAYIASRTVATRGRRG